MVRGRDPRFPTTTAHASRDATRPTATRVGTIADRRDEVPPVRPPISPALARELRERDDGGRKPGQPRQRHPRRAEAVQRHVDGGESTRTIATDLGVSRWSVSAWVREDTGITRRDRTRSPERQARAVELFQQGLGLDEIRKDLHSDYHLVRELLESAGIYPTARAAREALRERLQGNLCPCGGDTGSKDRTHCDSECRTKYGEQRYRRHT